MVTPNTRADIFFYVWNVAARDRGSTGVTSNGYRAVNMLTAALNAMPADVPLEGTVRPARVDPRANNPTYVYGPPMAELCRYAGSPVTALTVPPSLAPFEDGPR
ncbi:hypothetical protein AB0F17_34690 [Nonomuraea sp. NPDC026600]|uniref:hypothetical protein n=1 Tax=Nonomuraea sp. NPDC026600 TaxID=3155363 RepID=UPI0033E0C7D9